MIRKLTIEITVPEGNDGVRSILMKIESTDMKIETFDDALKLARQIMAAACSDAAKQLHCEPPTVREECTLTGVRLVVVWPDGEETNECRVDRLPRKC